MVSHFYWANLWKNLTEILHAATEAYIFWAMGIRTLSTFLLVILLKSQNSWFLETFPTTLWQSSRLFVALLNQRYFHQLKIIWKQHTPTPTPTHHTPDATFDFNGGREAPSQGSIGAELSVHSGQSRSFRGSSTFFATSLLIFFSFVVLAVDSSLGLLFLGFFLWL